MIFYSLKYSALCRHYSHNVYPYIWGLEKSVIQKSLINSFKKEVFLLTRVACSHVVRYCSASDAKNLEGLLPAITRVCIPASGQFLNSRVGFIECWSGKLLVPDHFRPPWSSWNQQKAWEGMAISPWTPTWNIRIPWNPGSGRAEDPWNLLGGWPWEGVSAIWLGYFLENQALPSLEILFNNWKMVLQLLTLINLLDLSIYLYIYFSFFLR